MNLKRFTSNVADQLAKWQTRGDENREYIRQVSKLPMQEQRRHWIELRSEYIELIESIAILNEACESGKLSRPIKTYGQEESPSVAVHPIWQLKERMDALRELFAELQSHLDEEELTDWIYKYDHRNLRKLTPFRD